jgi:hypothetical protein
MLTGMTGLDGGGDGCSTGSIGSKGFIGSKGSIGFKLFFAQNNIILNTILFPEGVGY